MENFISKFESVVKKYPKYHAVLVDGEHDITYEELYSQAIQIGSFLKSKGIQKEDIVAISLDKSAEYIAFMLGVWMAGGAFLPLLSSMPTERRSFILKKVKPKAIIFGGKSGSDVSTFQNTIDINEALSFKDAKYLPPSNKPEDLAYLIFTSGSTGEPKGVMVNHAGIPNLLEEQIRIFELHPQSRVLFFVSTSFDASISDIGTTLLSGSTLCIETKQSLEIASDLPRILTERKISHTDIPPSLLEVLDIDQVPDTLKTIVIGGEICGVETIKRWARKFRLVNVYGPTEATVCTSTVVCNPDSWDGPDIGKPIANTSYEILDENLESVGGGKPGELFISGIGLARGYFGMEVLTNERFPTVRGKKYYRTGDLVKRVGDKIYFVGRVDRQVKLRGQLIAPEEIEISLQAFSEINRAAVIVEEISNRKELIAFIETDGEVDQNSLKTKLSKSLSPWMIPNRFFALNVMPTNSSGKIDYGKLKNMLSKVNSSNETISADLGPVSRKLKEIWQGLLGRENVGVDDDFFALGGDSLLVLRVVTEAKKHNIDIPIGLLGTKSTIRGIVGWLEEQKGKISDGVSANYFNEDVAITTEWKDLFDTSRTIPEPEQGDVFITGATGFLGSHLLKELLKNSKRNIYVLTRSPDNDAAQKKISQACLKYGINLTSKDWARLIPVLGDMEKRQLGLDEGDWDSLSTKITDIYHCAATVNMVDSYEALKASNVDGVKEIVKFALEKVKKRIHYASTLSVFVATDRNTGTIFEDDDLSSTSVIYGGYAQSKWVAERFLEQIPKDVLKINIFRLGLITGNSKTGIYSEHDYLEMFVKGLVSLGVAPSGNHKDLSLDVTPVDYAAKAMASISSRSDGGCYHIANKKGFTLDSIIKALRRRKIKMKVLDSEKWVREVSCRQLSVAESAAFASLCRLFPAGGSFEQFRSMDLFQTTGILFDQKNTESMLHSTKIKLPKANLALLKRYLNHIFASIKMADRVLKICICGPESTGKSTLAEKLSKHFNTIFVPEYARDYLQEKIDKAKENGEHYEIGFDDLNTIARGQVDLENKLIPQANKILFSDTDVSTTTMWSKWLFEGKCDPEVRRLANENKHDLYLFTYPDISWQKDDMRYFPDQAERDRFFSEYEEMLKAMNANYAVIRGEGSLRVKNAIRAVEDFITPKPSNS